MFFINFNLNRSLYINAAPVKAVFRNVFPLKTSL